VVVDVESVWDTAAIWLNVPVVGFAEKTELKARDVWLSMPVVKEADRVEDEVAVKPVTSAMPPVATREV